MQPPPAKNSAFKWLWAVAGVSATFKEKALLFPLALHADGNGESYPGEATLCRESGIGSESTLRRTLRRLEGKGWITTNRNSHPVKIGERIFYANTYTLTIPTGRAVIAVTGHDTETGGQNELDGRSKQGGRAVKTAETGGHSCDRETTNRTTNELPEEEREGGALSQSVIEIPSLGVFTDFGRERGFDPARVLKCFRHYEASGWKDTHGQPVKNWKAKLSSWMNRPELESTKAGKPNWREERAKGEYTGHGQPRVI